MKIAGVQMDVAFGDVQSNLARISELATEAAAQGACLVIFPECAITGYCFDSKSEAIPHAASVPGEHTKALEAISKELGIYLVAGSLEVDGEDLYNVALCTGPEGFLGAYRKTHLPALGVDHFTSQGALEVPDDAYCVMDLGDIRIGMLICYDASFPEASRTLALKGADLIVLPTNWPPGAEPTADFVVNARASENKVYFIAVDRIGHERGFDFIGKSKIADTSGNTLSYADHRNHEILYADIEPELARDKAVYRGAGHSIDRFADRRPDLYSEVVKPTSVR